MSWVDSRDIKISMSISSEGLWLKQICGLTLLKPCWPRPHHLQPKTIMVIWLDWDGQPMNSWPHKCGGKKRQCHWVGVACRFIRKSKRQAAVRMRFIWTTSQWPRGRGIIPGSREKRLVLALIHCTVQVKVHIIKIAFQYFCCSWWVVYNEAGQNRDMDDMWQRAGVGLVPAVPLVHITCLTQLKHQDSPGSHQIMFVYHWHLQKCHFKKWNLTAVKTVLVLTF